MADRARTFLVVSASADHVAGVKAALASGQDQVLTCIDGDAALRIASSQRVDLAVLWLRLPAANGLEVLRTLRSLGPRHYVPAIFVAGPHDRATRLAALRNGADDVVEEPFDAEELAARAERCALTAGRIDALVEEAAGLQRRSIIDAATQLYNHRYFQDRLHEEFRRAQRYDHPLALVMLELDLFKELNDQHGAAVADQVLRDAAAVLRRCIRETDILCRCEGETFCALLPNTPFAGSLTVAERVWRDLASARMGPGLRVTASLGISGYPAQGVNSAEQLLRTADEALSRARREGRNQICLHAEVAPVRTSAGG